MRIPRAMAMAAVLIGGYAAVVRPRMLRWGATAEEAAARYPGDNLATGGTRISTMAATIDAPPRLVWPWLVQMGHDRGGWYSWDRLDNFGRSSADRIHPEWQDLAAGDRLLSTPDGTHWFDVAAVAPHRFLALAASFDAHGRQVGYGALRPPAYQESLWCFQLTELPQERTRLIVSLHTSGRVRPVQALTRFFFWEPAHWIMQTRQFGNLKRRAEQAVAEQAAGVVHRPGRPSAARAGAS